MVAGAHFTSFDAMEHEAQSLAALAHEVCTALDEVELTLRRYMGMMGNEIANLEAEMRSLEVAYEDANVPDDEGDVDYDRLREIEYEMERTRECSQQTGYYSQLLQDSVREFQMQAPIMRELAEKTAPKSVALINATLEQLRNYLNMTIQGGAGGPAVSALSSASSGSGVSSTNLAEMPLPSGFRWASLQDMNLCEIPPDMRFVKASKEDLLKAFNLLRTKILPEIQMDSTANIDRFIAMDKAVGKAYPGDLAKTYELFFGFDSIHVQGLPGQKLSIDSGRHRIKVAQELGWTSVPVRKT